MILAIGVRGNVAESAKRWKVKILFPKTGVVSDFPGGISDPNDDPKEILDDLDTLYSDRRWHSTSKTGASAATGCRVNR